MEPGRLPEVTDLAIDLLSEGGMIYQRAGALVRTVRLDVDTREDGLVLPAGDTVIHLVDRDWLLDAMARVGDWRKYSPMDGKWRRADPMQKYANGALARVGSWPFPYLRSVVDVPPFLSDGRVLTAAGYDRTSGVLYAPRPGFMWPEVPEEPTKTDAEAAMKVLFEPVAEFPWQHDSDKAGYLAAVLTLVGREAIDGPVPLFAYRARTRGTGKSLLARVVVLAATGREPATTTYTTDDEELRKRITAFALRGARDVTFDDVSGSIGSQSLEKAITNAVWNDRILGRNEDVSLPLRPYWAITGSMTFHRTLARRVVPVDLDAKSEHPEDRSFRIADLPAWTKGHHPQLLAAALTILRAYWGAGRPEHGQGPRMGSFEQWDDLIRGAVVWALGIDPAGVNDPGAGRGRIRATSDDEADASATLVHTLRAKFNDGTWTTSDVWHATGLDREDLTRDKALRDAVVAAASTRDGRPPTLVSLGIRIGQLAGQLFDGVQIVRLPRSSSRLPQRWRIEGPGDQLSMAS
jgi:putative DNA primase/helicase